MPAPCPFALPWRCLSFFQRHFWVFIRIHITTSFFHHDYLCLQLLDNQLDDEKPIQPRRHVDNFQALITLLAAVILLADPC